MILLKRLYCDRERTPNSDSPTLTNYMTQNAFREDFREIYVFSNVFPTYRIAIYLHGDHLVLKMFNKKPRRNFRQRKGQSSDEDEQQKSGEDDGSKTQATASSIKPVKLPQNRGISCSSKREAMSPKSDSSGAEDAVEYGTSGPIVGTRPPNSKEDKDGRKKKGNVLSFSNEKEGKRLTCFVTN